MSLTPVQKEVLAFLKDNMKIEITDGGFTDPNRRELKVMIGIETICETSFDVVQKSEYRDY